MKQFWKIMNIVYEKIVFAVFVVALLVVIYALYDTWYVFDHASDDSYLRFKPDRVNAAEIEDSPITADMVAWITVDDTNIDYPVLYTPYDEQKYLRKNFDGDYALAGTLFLSADSDPVKPTVNMIIYGHNMKDGSMFGSLKQIWRNGKLTDPYI